MKALFMRLLIILMCMTRSLYVYAGEANYVLLDSSFATKLMAQCSRPTPTIDRSWNPTPLDVAALESRLDSISHLTVEGCCIVGARIDKPRQTLRQYVGVIVNGRRFIYLNAFPEAEFDDWPSQMPKPDWRMTPYIVCDGGTSYWGVLYDPVTGTFSVLATNGVA